MSDNIDFEQLIDLLDRALTSKDPKVISALKKFLFIAALATEETEEEGPFANLVRRIEALEAAQQSTKISDWLPQSTQQPYWYAGPHSITCGSPKYYFNDTSSTGAVLTNTTSTSMNDTLINETMKELEELYSQSASLQK